MKKHTFLVPLAVAIAALIDSAHATDQTGDHSVGSASPDLTSNTQNSVSDSFDVTSAAGRIDSFVLARAEDGMLFAQHESHSSHSSHASHASHSSHTSGISLA